MINAPFWIPLDQSTNRPAEQGKHKKLQTRTLNHRGIVTKPCNRVLTTSRGCNSRVDPSPAVAPASASCQGGSFVRKPGFLAFFRTVGVSASVSAALLMNLAKTLWPPWADSWLDLPWWRLGEPAQSSWRDSTERGLCEVDASELDRLLLRIRTPSGLDVGRESSADVGSSEPSPRPGVDIRSLALDTLESYV